MFLDDLNFFTGTTIIFLFTGKTLCQACKKKCSGEVLRVQEKYFHTDCFKCKVCSNSLAQGGFFSKDGSYYCTADYQRNFGTKCATCGDYVEGEVRLFTTSNIFFLLIFCVLFLSKMTFF